MKKCDEQVKIRDEQARGVKMEGKMRADFLDRRTGFAGFMPKAACFWTSECSAGVSLAWVSRSMAGETPALP
jgi:hypothetical protein